jgi:hypothetical protein
MNAYGGSEYLFPHILWRWVVSFILQPLYPQVKSPRCPFDRRLGGPQSRSFVSESSQQFPFMENMEDDIKNMAIKGLCKERRL